MRFWLEVRAGRLEDGGMSRSFEHARRVVVTCGPAHAPIDGVRRITNFSTGELGAVLCRELVEAGFQVVCLRGEGATHPLPDGVGQMAFGTNRDLLDALGRCAGEGARAVFHAAAMADFEVDPASLPPGGKIRSDHAPFTLGLRPAEKILPCLRELFPDALIAGWKYEVDGSPGEAAARAADQIVRCRTDACILNGPAYGPGFAFLDGRNRRHLVDKQALSRFLADWVEASTRPGR
jgi:phosphopantothenate---cysteine ligase (CTP)